MKLNIDEINLLKQNITKLINDINVNIKILSDMNANNTIKNNLYNSYLQEIINEYHNSCKKLFII